MGKIDLYSNSRKKEKKLLVYDFNVRALLGHRKSFSGPYSKFDTFIHTVESRSKASAYKPMSAYKAFEKIFASFSSFSYIGSKTFSF